MRHMGRRERLNEIPLFRKERVTFISRAQTSLQGVTFYSSVSQEMHDLRSLPSAGMHAMITVSVLKAGLDITSP